MTDDARRNVLDELAEQFGGGRNPRKEAEALRGRFLTLWMDFEVSLDTAIGEFLEVPEHRWDAMEYGLLPLLPAGRKVDFLQIVVKSVDPASDAFQLSKRALALRNGLAHRPAAISVLAERMIEGKIPTYAYKNGEARLVQLDARDALDELERAHESVTELHLKARPDYIDRMKARAND